MINVSSWSIRNPIPGMLLFIMLTAVGLMSFKAMKIQNFPDIDLPTVTVTASLPGASPSQLETDVARKIENQLATLQGVKHIYTSVQDGVSTTTVEFRLEKPTQEAVDDVRDAVSRVRSDLPADLRDPIIAKFDLAGSPILTYTVASSRMDDEALSWFVDDTVTRTLLAVRGVGAVTRVGGATREVRVELDPARLLALERHRRRHLAPAAPDAARELGRPHRRRRRRAVGAHDRHRAVGGRAGAAGDHALRRPAHPPRPGRARQRHRRRAALGRVPERQAGGRLRDRAHARRRRGRRRARRARGAGDAEDDPPRHHDHRGVQLRRPGRAELQRLDGAALRGRRARRAGGVPVPARLARDAGRVDGAAAVDHPGVLGDGAARLLAQRRDAAGAVAGRRHPGRRRDRRDREHHAPPRHGQAPVRRRDGGGRRDRPGGDRHHLHAGRGVPADRVHERRAGQVLQAVRLDRGDRRVLLARGGAAADADDGGLRAQAAEEGACRGSLDRDLSHLDALVPAPPRADDDRRADLLLRLARAGAAAADRLHPARRPLADAGADRPAAGRDLRADQRHRRGRAPDRRPEPVREADLHDGRRRLDRRRPVPGRRRRRGAQGDLDAQPHAARGARRGEEAGGRAAAARRSRRRARARASTSASAARTRSTRSSSPARTAPCSRSVARNVEQELRTLHGIGNVTSSSSLVRPETHRPARLGARRRPRRHRDRDRRDAARRHCRRLRPEPGQAQPVAAPGADRRQAAARGAHRPWPDRAPGGAGRARAGDARQRRDAGDRQRAGQDRPLRPPAQHQLRHRAEPAAARRGAGAKRSPWRACSTCRRGWRRRASATPRR